MPAFLSTVTPDEARAAFARFGPPGRAERVPVDRAWNRVALEDVPALEPLPAFDRALMDGYAVRARNTFGASEDAPLCLAMTGRVAMGAAESGRVGDGEAREVSTGGLLPEGADAVAMVEHCREVTGDRLEVSRPVAPGENLIRTGEDLARGARLVAGGARLTDRHILALAAAGVAEVAVFARPRVGILSTGDELVPAGDGVSRGRVRDATGPALRGFVERAGGEPVAFGICPDDPARLRAAVAAMIERCDAVLVCGGSSVGSRDVTHEILGSIGSPGLLLHGISVAPGKPTILAGAGQKPLVGLPGHPVSSLVVARLFVEPMVRTMGGERGAVDPFPRRARARMARPVPSRTGREEYLRVALEGGIATPVPGGSGAVSTLLYADGLVRVPLGVGGVAAGEEVEVLLW